MLEIRWHGRGGQGTKTASNLFAEIIFKTGKYIQSFPEYGPERTGAPITAYNRVDDKKINIHSNIYEPDVVVIVDDSLLQQLDLIKGVKDNGIILINTAKEFNEIPILKEYLEKGVEIYKVDANKISLEEIGRVFPNIPMLSALINVLEIVEYDKYIEYITKAIKETFSHKEEVIEGNITTAKRAYHEVIRYIK